MDYKQTQDDVVGMFECCYEKQHLCLLVFISDLQWDERQQESCLAKFQDNHKDLTLFKLKIAFRNLKAISNLFLLSASLTQVSFPFLLAFHSSFVLTALVAMKNLLYA